MKLTSDIIFYWQYRIEIKTLTIQTNKQYSIKIVPFILIFKCIVTKYRFFFTLCTWWFLIYIIYTLNTSISNNIDDYRLDANILHQTSFGYRHLMILFLHIKYKAIIMITTALYVIRSSLFLETQNWLHVLIGIRNYLQLINKLIFSLLNRNWYCLEAVPPLTISTDMSELKVYINKLITPAVTCNIFTNFMCIHIHVYGEKTCWEYWWY